MRQNFICAIFLLCAMWVQQFRLQAQNDCNFKEPVFKIDFGSESDESDLNESPLPHYRRVFYECPPDGHYSFVSYTSDCFHGDWHTFTSDHTPNDGDGKMMVVNGNPFGGVFFTAVIHGLKGNTTYQLSACLVNLCRLYGTWPPLPPNIAMKLLTPEGKTVASFQSGPLPQTTSPQWKVYSAIFTTSSNAGTLLLVMEDITTGGRGNDFALDDIIFRECVKQMPVAKTQTKPTQNPAEKKATSATKPVIKKPFVKTTPAKKDSVIVSKKPAADTPSIARQTIQEKPAALPVPKPILTRANPLIKRIETAAGEIVIDLYDNGQIDGDTVSIYHNNALIVSRAALSAKAINLRIKVDATHPHHEVIMVANNLGSIPPNTSLMIITANTKRYEVFISSSEQKNAKIAFDFRE